MVAALAQHHPHIGQLDVGGRPLGQGSEVREEQVGEEEGMERGLGEGQRELGHWTWVCEIVGKDGGKSWHYVTFSVHLCM